VKVYLYACKPAKYIVGGPDRSYNLKLSCICYDAHQSQIHLKLECVKED